QHAVVTVRGVQNRALQQRVSIPLAARGSIDAKTKLGRRLARIGREMRNTDELKVRCQYSERVIPREIDSGDVPFDRRVVDRSAKTQPPVIDGQAQQMANDLRAVRSAQLLHYDARWVIHSRPQPTRRKARRRRHAFSAFGTAWSARIA